MPTNQFPFITTMKIPGVGLTLLVGLLLQFSLRAQEESRAEPPSPISFVASRISQHYHSILNVIVNTPFEPKAALPLEEMPSFELALKRFANMVSGYDLIQIGGSRVLLPKAVIQDNTFPLNVVHPAYRVNYTSGKNRNGAPFHRILFDDALNFELNLAINMLSCEGETKIGKTNGSEEYKNQTLLFILSSIAERERKAWCCYRVPTAFAEGMNQRMTRAGVKPSWKDLSRPCYLVSWNPIPFTEAPPEEVERIKTSAAMSSKISQAMRSGITGPLRIEASVVKGQNDDQPLLRITVKNIGANDISIPNPFKNGAKGCLIAKELIDRQGSHCEYRFDLNQTPGQSESEKLTLRSGASTERCFNVFGIKMTLDPLASDLERVWAPESTLGPGKHKLSIAMYYTDEAEKGCYTRREGLLELDYPRKPR
ncbi:MAG: hypothetical protein PHV34_22770 [Verrucomicrobiae bacterium]|nr:hypothetical protein [Verrucomicrobiae bacterium]